jgi:hypothetical protein
MSTREIQENLARNMKAWQRIEDVSAASTGQIIAKTENPLIRLVMEIIQQDSLMHHRVQGFIEKSMDGTMALSPDDLAIVWDGIAEHIEIERKMLGYVDEALAELKGKRMPVQEYLLSYLKQDEEKHDALLSALEKIKGGMYPYG